MIHTSFFEQGTGTYTTLRQTVAEELGCDPDLIQIKTLDTDAGVSSDTGLGGSRGTRVASGAAFQAARAAKEELLGLAETMLGWTKSDTMLSGKKIVNKKTKKQQPWDELLARAGRSITGESVNKDDDHSPVTAFAAQVAEVAVDPETGEVTLRRLTTAHDTGVIMNPVGHQGQIDGGVVQGIGYGLIEYLAGAGRARRGRQLRRIQNSHRQRYPGAQDRDRCQRRRRRSVQSQRHRRKPDQPGGARDRQRDRRRGGCENQRSADHGGENLSRRCARK